MRNFKARITGGLLFCSLFLVTTIFYFMIVLEEPKVTPKKRVLRKPPVILFNFEEHKTNNETLEQFYGNQIQLKLRNVQQKSSDDVKSDQLFSSLKGSLTFHKDAEPISVIKTVKSWIRARQIVPNDAPILGDIIHLLQTSAVISADVFRPGTQLKLLLTLENSLQVLFKPQRYSREYVAPDSHSGSDRHNSEIVSFHLSRLLGFRANPIVASRKLSVVNEIKNLSSEALRKTFLQDEDQELCFYGECYYCNEYDPVCPEPSGQLEGAVIMMLPQQYKVENIKNPWQRTYRASLLAKWQTDINYCLQVRKSLTGERLLDFVDSAIFDFLIGNSDRHHHQVWKDVPNSGLLLIDNGKGFANPTTDELSILFPLLQCCQLRKLTFDRLSHLSQFHSKDVLEDLLSSDILWPLLEPQYYDALDRRIRIVLASIELCQETHENVIVRR